MCSVVCSHWSLSAASLRSSSSPFTFLRFIPTFSTSVHRVLKKHFGGLPRLPFRCGLIDTSRVICAEASRRIWRQCPRRRSLACCRSTERWFFLWVCTMHHCWGGLASNSLLVLWDVCDGMRTASLWGIQLAPMSHNHRASLAWPEHSIHKS